MDATARESWSSVLQYSSESINKEDAVQEILWLDMSLSETERNVDLFPASSRWLPSPSFSPDKADNTPLKAGSRELKDIATCLKMASDPVK